MLFSASYIAAKGLEFVERGKNLKKALVNVLQDIVSHIFLFKFF